MKSAQVADIHQHIRGDARRWVAMMAGSICTNTMILFGMTKAKRKGVLSVGAQALSDGVQNAALIYRSRASRQKVKDDNYHYLRIDWHHGLCNWIWSRLRAWSRDRRNSGTIRAALVSGKSIKEDKEMTPLKLTPAQLKRLERN